jgi:hypothetical protein
MYTPGFIAVVSASPSRDPDCTFPAQRPRGRMTSECTAFSKTVNKKIDELERSPGKPVSKFYQRMERALWSVTVLAEEDTICESQATFLAVTLSWSLCVFARARMALAGWSLACAVRRRHIIQRVISSGIRRGPCIRRRALYSPKNLAPLQACAGIPPLEIQRVAGSRVALGRMSR